jgi:hypothetical protein
MAKKTLHEQYRDAVKEYHEALKRADDFYDVVMRLYELLIAESRDEL